ncbi:hypothetical protein [Saccharopolyspora spinosa]|uniref:hypothetical protein n=1 Tax=Saccharopolyspora spinosa TaxID=60894 RepID=UPI0002378BE7|nr:hypothetical protein [Saccharopolyspora spinosa]
MVLWGLTSAAMMLGSDATTFYVLRFLLGGSRPVSARHHLLPHLLVPAGADCGGDGPADAADPIGSMLAARCRRG